MSRFLLMDLAMFGVTVCVILGGGMYIAQHLVGALLDKKKDWWLISFCVVGVTTASLLMVSVVLTMMGRWS